MSAPEQAPSSLSASDQAAIDQARRKKTILLMIGGAVSLILPLLGVAYLRMRDSGSAKGPQHGSEVFEKREADQAKITPSETTAPEAAMPMPGTPAAPKAADGYGGTAPAASPLPGGRGPAAAMGSSLDFIKSAEMGKNEAPSAPAVAAQAAPTAPPPAAEPEPTPAPAKSSTKPGKKAFAMPKLNPSRGFSNNFGSKSGMGASGAGTGDAPPDIPPDLLKNIPEANNPDVQKMLKKGK